MNRIKLWPHATLIMLGCAIIAGAAALIFIRYERTAEAKSLPSAARIERVDGQVGLNHSADNSTQAEWVDAVANTPITVGDRVLTRDNSRTEIAFTGRNFATLDANTSLDVLDLSDQRTQLALRNGSALFDVGSLASGELFEVATPCGAVDLEQPGVYQITIDDHGTASATTLNGLAQVVGQGGTGKIDKGEVLTIPCQGGSGAVLSKVDNRQAGAVLDSYYRYRYPRKYDGRYTNYYTYLDDPYYFDPYRHDVSYQYVSDYIPGIYDLDDYGDWVSVSNYGYCWHPRVDVGWAPYQTGFWETEYPFGPTWVSYEPWGYAPYHYGRWAFVSDQWFWVPDRINTRPVYSPALVAFISVNQASTVAWVPLGPGDPYVPRYYDPNWTARFVGREDFRDRLVNQGVTGAVTVVSLRDFNRRIDNTVILRADQQAFAHARPVFDPMSIDPLRRAALEARGERHRFDVPPGLAQRLNNPVITGSVPVGPPFRNDLARALRVQTLPDKIRNQRLQLRDERAVSAGANQVGANASASASIAADQARERQMADLSVRSARGDRAARQELRVLQRQQFESQRAERVAAQQARGEQVRAQVQAQQAQAAAARDQQRLQREALRQQQQTQREAARQEQILNKQQRRAMRPAEPQAERVGNRVRNAPPPRADRSPQTVRPQMPPQVRTRRPPQAEGQPQRVQPQRIPQGEARPKAPRMTERPQMQVPRPQVQPRTERRLEPAVRTPEPRTPQVKAPPQPVKTPAGPVKKHP
jgi:FecR protein